MIVWWGSGFGDTLPQHLVTTTLTILLCCALVQGRTDATAMTPRHSPYFLDHTTEITSVTATTTASSRLHRRDADDELAQRCAQFIVGNPDESQFYSPMFPRNYSNNTDCVRVLDAGSGFLLKMDFRNGFHIEPSDNCQYDFLEVRDGGHGYDHLIGKFCGQSHPDIVTSSGRHLWLHFHSDENIEYSGFSAVYERVPRPTTDHDPPEMENCSINKNGSEGYIRQTDIDEYRMEIAREYHRPVDCMWIIRVAEGWKIQLSFREFKLEKPNDCESNFVDVFKERTDIESRLKLFCGAIAEMVTSDTNLMHVRFFTDPNGFNSKFEALYTAFREANKKGCKSDEFDCQDDTCISSSLTCNGRHNCRFLFDEDESMCKDQKDSFFDIIGADHIIIILVIFCLILSGMCFAFLYNCTKKLIRDHRIIQEHLRQSREGHLDNVGKAVQLVSPRIGTTGRSRSGSSSAGGGTSLSPHHLLRAVRAAVSGAGSDHEREDQDSSPQRSAPEDCYVPGAGDLLPILLSASRGTSAPVSEPRAGIPANGDAVFLRDGHQHHHHPQHQHDYGEDECDDLEMATFPMPEMRDNECQTRESLFLNTNSDHSLTPPPPPPPIASRFSSLNPSESRSIPRLPPQHHNSSSNTSGFSTFGYNSNRDNRNRGGSRDNQKDYSTLPQHHHHHHHHQIPPPTEAQRFRAEAVIEMEHQQQQQQQQQQLQQQQQQLQQQQQHRADGGGSAGSAGSNRPFSVESTKSAPDVIVTH